MHSEGREDKQVHMYKEIIPVLSDRRPPSIVFAALWKTLGFRTQVRSGLCHSLFFLSGIFVSRVFAAFKRRIMHSPSAHRLLAVYLTLFGYLGDVYAGTVLMNSNAIKNLPGAPGGKSDNTVSPSPRTSPSGGMAHKLPVDTLQVMNFPVRKSQLICAPRQMLRTCTF